MGTGLLRRYHEAHGHAAQPTEKAQPQAIDPASVVATAQVLNEFKPKPEVVKPRIPSLHKEPKEPNPKE